MIVLRNSLKQISLQIIARHAKKMKRFILPKWCLLRQFPPQTGRKIPIRKPAYRCAIIPIFVGVSLVCKLFSWYFENMDNRRGKESCIMQNAKNRFHHHHRRPAAARRCAIFGNSPVGRRSENNNMLVTCSSSTFFILVPTSPTVSQWRLAAAGDLASRYSEK